MPHTVIVDWLNYFCSVIQFRKHRHFEVDRFISAFHSLCDTAVGVDRLIVVAKEQWEIPLDVIEALVAGETRLQVQFVIVRDLYLANKGLNRERDDFICALLHATYRNSRLLTNDKLRNYTDMVDRAKPVLVTWVSSDGVATYYLDDAALDALRAQVRGHTVRRSTFQISRGRLQGIDMTSS